MIKLYLDTNILLDFLGERHPFYDAVAKLVTLADKGKVALTASPLSFATTYYLLSKYETPSIAREKLQKFKILCGVSNLNEQHIEKALSSSFSDFEDAIQYFCALESNSQIIITRNPKDYKNASLPIMSAEEYLNSIQKSI